MAGTGFRIQHKTLREKQLVTVAVHSKRFKAATHCLLCTTPEQIAKNPPEFAVHRVKTYHLELEEDGTCLVSDGVLNSLGEAGAIQMKGAGRIAGHDPIFDLIVNEDNPPPQNLLLGRKAPIAGNNQPRMHVDYEEDNG